MKKLKSVFKLRNPQAVSQLLLASLGFLLLAGPVGFFHIYNQPSSELSEIAQSHLNSQLVSDTTRLVPQIIVKIDLASRISGPTVSATDSHAGGLTRWFYIVTSVGLCNSDLAFANATGYTEGRSVDILPAHDGQVFCFRSTDRSTDRSTNRSTNGNLHGYASSTLIDAIPPTITVTNPTTRAESSKTVSAESADEDVDIANFTYKIFHPDQSSCNAALMVGEPLQPGSPITGSSVVLDDGRYNGQQVCFSLRDNHYNYAYQASEVISGLSAAAAASSIRIQLTPETISATDDETDTTWSYLVVADAAGCRADTDFTDATSYTEGEVVEIDQANQAGKYFCFQTVNSSDETDQASKFIPVRPVIIAIEASESYAGTQGVARELLMTIVFSEDIVIIDREIQPFSCGDRRVWVETNASDKHNLNVCSSYIGQRVEFLYKPHVGDYTEDAFLTATRIAHGQSVTIRDVDGNDAILEVPETVDLADSVKIHMDTRQTGVTINHPADFGEVGGSKTISAVDDWDNNNNLENNSWPDADYYAFEYYFLPNDGWDPAADPLTQVCTINAWFIEPRYSYIEGEDIVLTEEHNDHFICFRSRRADQRLHDLSNQRDWGAAVSYLVRNIDDHGPDITFGYLDDQVTPTVTDPSGVDDSSLYYVISQGVATDCSQVSYNSAVAYVNHQPIEVAAAFESDHVFCFTAADILDNKSYVPFYPFAIGSDIAISQITSSTPDNIYGLGAQIEIQVRFSGIVWLDSDESIQVELDSGGFANYTGGAYTRTLSFNYTVQAGQNSPDLNALAFELSSIYAVQGLNSNLIDFSLPPVGNNLADSKNIIIDTTPPVLQVGQVVDNSVTAVADDQFAQSVFLEVQLLDEFKLCSAESTVNNFETYLAGSVVELADDQKACFRATDPVGNVAYASSTTGLDVNPPVITVKLDISGRTVRATDNKQLPTTWFYDIVIAGIDCRELLLPAGHQTNVLRPYVEGSYIPILDNYHGYRVCFKSADQGAKDSGYAESAIIDLEAPIISTETDYNQVVAVDDDATKTDWSYQVIADQAVCDQTSFGASARDYQEGQQLVVQGGGSGLCRVCFRSVDASGNAGYAASDTINQPPVTRQPQPPVANPEESDPEVLEVIVPPPVVQTLPSPELTDDGFPRWLLVGLQVVYALVLILLVYFLIRRRRQDQDDEA